MQITIDTSVLESLLILATVIEARDSYTGGHAWRVAKYAERLAIEAGMSDGETFAALVGGLVHDIGKVGVPDAVLNKRGKLDDSEMAAMHAHPGIGTGVIERHPLAILALKAVAGHHERPDGKGYPLGGSSEPPYARIIGIADAFDAMTSDRPYRKGMPSAEAAAIIKECRTSQFDAELADKFIGLVEKGALAHVIGHANDFRAMLACGACGLTIAPPAHIHDGDHITCPVCAGDYVLHASGSSFQPEWTGQILKAPVPAPDRSAIDAVMRVAPKTVAL